MTIKELDQTYEDRLDNLVQYAKSQVRALAEGDFENSLWLNFDLENLNSDSIAEIFSRSDLAEEYKELISQEEGIALADMVRLSVQQEFLAAMEKAFRERTRGRATRMVQATSRDKGHASDLGYLQHALRSVPLKESL